MSAALHWYQHPGLAVRWALLLLVLAAHAALLWLWSIDRTQTQVPQITPVTVVLADPRAAPMLVTKAVVETPVQRPAPARQVANAVTPQILGPAGPQVAPQVTQQPVQQTAPGQALALPPVYAQANIAPVKASGGDPSAAQAAAVSPAGAMRDSGATVSSAGARAGGSTQTVGASPALGSGSSDGSVSVAPSASQSIADICPHRVKAIPPARATQAGLGGMVLARATIQGGKVRRVDILKSEPSGLYDAAVRTAMAQYVCRDQGALEVLAEQRFEFKLVE